jgi:hypothetical protein
MLGWEIAKVQCEWVLRYIAAVWQWGFVEILESRWVLKFLAQPEG